jgi:two-component system chemotaxis sensor kinase CheA
LLRNILESAGYTVKTAVDGLEALMFLKNGEFNLVVSDVEMPGLNGFELITKLREDKRFGDLPVILVTALDSASDRQRGMDCGANAYIVKSDFEQSNLLEVIRRLI